MWVALTYRLRFSEGLDIAIWSQCLKYHTDGRTFVMSERGFMSQLELSGTGCFVQERC